MKQLPTVQQVCNYVCALPYILVNWDGSATIRKLNIVYCHVMHLCSNSGPITVLHRLQCYYFMIIAVCDSVFTVD